MSVNRLKGLIRKEWIQLKELGGLLPERLVISGILSLYGTVCILLINR